METKKQTHVTFIRLASISMLAGVLFGCATMSKKDCQYADWYAVGEKDGSRGASSDYFIRHNKACAGIATPNAQRWEQGRKSGLKNYCTPLNVYAKAREGLALMPVCGFLGRTELMDLHASYEEGRKRYMFEKQMDSIFENQDRLDYPWRIRY